MIRGIHLVVSLCLMAGQVHAATTASDVLKDSGVRGGLVVVVGCEDAELMIGLGEQKGYLVHGLDTQSDRIRMAVSHVSRASSGRSVGLRASNFAT
ncbi:MAG: hypothetical protein H8E44_25010 [Planctomycetes bacterium]|nr:hypothetical protein [Planctomycetota bacterium]MBL7038766.1 hypothetical protein [Pirellulaceae bacterium]